MFERFTDGARRVVALSQDEARLLGHGHIGTDHLVLGVLRAGDPLAARALDSLGIGLQPARDAVAAGTDGEPNRGRGRAGHIPFSPEAKRCLENAHREAARLGQDDVGAEHIVLGLTGDAASAGARLLAGLGAAAGTVRQRLIETITIRPEPPAAAADDYGWLASRLAALERWAGLVPDLAELDEQIARVRRDTDAAIDAHEFRAAEALSDTEHELMAERDRRSRQRTAGPSLAEQVAQLQAEVDSLHEVLRSHGIDPGAPAAAS